MNKDDLIIAFRRSERNPYVLFSARPRPFLYEPESSRQSRHQSGRDQAVRRLRPEPDAGRVYPGRRLPLAGRAVEYFCIVQGLAVSIGAISTADADNPSQRTQEIKRQAIELYRW
jgi:hypothetical protein